MCQQSGVVPIRRWELKPSLLANNAHFPVREDSSDGFLIDRLRTRGTNGHLNIHVLARLPKHIGDAQVIAPQSIFDSTRRGFGAVRLSV